MKRTLELVKPTLLIAAVLLAVAASPPTLLAQGVPGSYSTLIDVNFGAHQSPGLDANKVGWAATGLTVNDFWNFYSRDDGQGHWLVNGVLPNLRFADGSASSAGLIVSNAPGCWADGSSDAMYNTYVYPFDGGNTSVTVTNLAAGHYDLYVYGPNGTYQLTVGSTNYGSRTSFDWPVINPTVWQEGRQYAVYRGVPVGVAQSVTLTVLPNACGSLGISGLQIGAAPAVTGTSPSILRQPRSQKVGGGTNVTFSVAATGTPPLSYQWRFNGTNLAGATLTALALANVQSANAGSYSVRVTNAFGSILSSNATLTVTQAAPNTLINVDFGAGPATSGSPKAGPAAVGHATNDFWNFYTRDEDSGGWRTFGVLSNLKFANGAVSRGGMTVLNAPGAWGDGSSDPMYASYIYPFDGGNVTVTVTNLATGQYDFYVYGPDGNYQLAVGPTDYGVKTTLEASVINPPVWQEGRQYALYRGVSVGAGQIVSLTVRPGLYGYAVISGMQISSAGVLLRIPPVILAQPQSQTVGVGSNVTFAITALGSSPLSYQWRLGGTNLAGATRSALALANVQLANAGDYSVRVTNAYGSILSSIATLTVTQAAPNTLINVDFGAGPATGGSPKAGPAAVGQTTNDFWNFYTRDDESGGWRTFGVLSNLKFANGAVASGGMTVLNAPGAWGDGSSDPMYDSYIYPFDGGNVAVTVTNLAVGQYDFYVYGPDGNYQLNVGLTDYGVKTTSEALVSNPPVWQEGLQYALYRGVSVGAGQVVSLTVRPGVYGYAVISGMQIGAATVVTGTPPGIVTQPRSQTVEVATSATFTVGATGTAPLSYQWRLGGTNLAGATTSSLGLANVQRANAGIYSVRVANAFGSILSSNATLTVIQATPRTLINVDFGAGPATSGSPKAGPAAVGQATNDFWNFYTRDDGSGGWRTFGVLSSLKFANGALSGSGLTVLNAPGAWADGSSDPMYDSYIYPFDGGNVLITITNLAAGQYDFYVYGPDGDYQLTVGATDYGVKTAVDQVANPPVWQEGRQYALYRGVLVGAGQSVNLTARPGEGGYAVISGIQISSAGVLLGIPPVIVAQPRSQTVGVGSNVTFAITALGSSPLSYQWRLGGTNLAGATRSALVLANVQLANAGSYSVRVTNAFGSILSSNATLTVTQAAPNTLLNVDFGAGPASGGSPKAGPAAVGQTTNDFWNFYTRDDDSGGWRTFGVLSDLKFANGAVSSGGMTVLNAPGAWGDGSSDPMYDSYIYPFDGANVTVTVTNLAVGQYDFYVYGPDGNYQLAVGPTFYGMKTTLDQPLTNPPSWEEGRQYALYRGVSVGAGQGVILTVRPGVYGYAVISGMQIASPVAARRPQRQTALLKLGSVPSTSGGSRVQLEFLGAPNRVYMFQVSTTLTEWVTIGLCVTDANGSVTLTDPDAGQYPARLYRVVAQ